MLKTRVDVGGRVFANRPSPLFLEELPCICVHFGPEPTTVITGSPKIPRDYERNLTLYVDIINDDPIDEESTPEQSQKNEDFVDEIAFYIERAFDDDIFLAKDLPDYNPRDKTKDARAIGLTYGRVLSSTDPYNADSKGDRRVIGSRLSWQLPYGTSAVIDKKLEDFNEYNAKFQKVGATEDTVDPTLLEAEGTI